jgi:hypothetical protein
MVALAVIVDKVFSDGPAKVSFAERDDPIEAFALVMDNTNRSE